MVTQLWLDRLRLQVKVEQMDKMVPVESQDQTALQAHLVHPVHLAHPDYPVQADQVVKLVLPV